MENDNQLQIVRHLVDRLNIYEVTDSELDQLERGFPSRLSLNFSIGLLSASVTLVPSLFTTPTNSTVFVLFLCSFFTFLILGLFFLIGFLIRYGKDKEKVSKIFRRIRERTKSTDNSSTSVYDLAPFLKKIYLLEKDHKFVGLNWLRKKKLAGDSASQTALQICLDKKFLIKYKVQNVKKPNRPVTACKINRDNGEIKRIFDL